MSSTSRTSSSAQGGGNSNRVRFAWQKTVFWPRSSVASRHQPLRQIQQLHSPEPRIRYQQPSPPTVSRADSSLERVVRPSARSVNRPSVPLLPNTERIHQSDLLRLERAVRPHLFNISNFLKRSIMILVE